ncbi:glutamate receptor ionotropic, kainate 1-like, partial [Bradysia coprophila]|uniref:glutamate receptor ionotropic, kainate 1-like n=1 Tax=Bradysia coprophila TaxID=38358 RepID=UPI00187D9E1E
LKPDPKQTRRLYNPPAQNPTGRVGFAGYPNLRANPLIPNGVVKGGSTASFFRNSNNPTYDMMRSTMESSELTAFVSNSAEGVSRVVKGDGKYAFLMESVAIEYVTERRCDLTQVGPVLDSKSYGIAMTKNSTYRSQVNVAILKLQENGKLQTLQKRWWKEKRGGGSCDFFSSNDNFVYELGFDNLIGDFIVLIIGLGIACIIGACECLFKSRMERYI